MQSSNYTEALKAAGLRSPSELIKVWEVNPMGGGKIIRDRLWFYLTYRESYAENTIPGMFFNRNGGDPDEMARRFRYQPAGRSTTPACGTTSAASRGRSRRATRSTSRTRSSTARPTERAAERGPRRHRPADTGSAGIEPLYAGAHADTHLDLAVHQQDAARGRLGQLPGELRQRRAAHRRPAQSGVDFGPRTDRRRERRRPGFRVQRRPAQPDLPVRQSARRRIPASSDRHAGQPQRRPSRTSPARRT